MVILLPNEKEGLADMESKLATFNFTEIISRLQPKRISLSMPRFKLESTIDLKDPLSKVIKAYDFFILRENKFFKDFTFHC